MTSPSIQQVESLVVPLLRTLTALEHVSRNFYPPQYASLLAGLGTPEEELVAARGQPDWPDPYSALRPQLDRAADSALAAMAGLREAATAPEGVRVAYRAMRHTSRALESLYPLAGIVPPVNRFFLDPERRSDEALQRRYLAPSQQNTGFMCVGENPDKRDSIWLYAPEWATPETPLPVVVALHGGSGNGRAFLWSWVRAARTLGALVIAPSSVGPTWAIHGEDEDSPNIAGMLEFARGVWTLDETKLLLTGMSDGGTFTWTSGLDPASPFTHLAPVAAAFHPMLAQAADAARMKNLPVHIMHGALDWMFPVDMARNADDYMRRAGASVTYCEIADLSHTYAPELSSMILDWLLK